MLMMRIRSAQPRRVARVLRGHGDRIANRREGIKLGSDRGSSRPVVSTRASKRRDRHSARIVQRCTRHREARVRSRARAADALIVRARRRQRAVRVARAKRLFVGQPRQQVVKLRVRAAGLSLAIQGTRRYVVRVVSIVKRAAAN